MSYFKLGDKVKIKPFYKIENTLNYDDYYDDLFFDSDMKQFCGNTETLLDLNARGKVWQLNNRWWWHEDWIEHIEVDMFTDKDFEI